MLSIVQILGLPSWGFPETKVPGTICGKISLSTLICFCSLGGVEYLEAINPEPGFRWLSLKWHPDTSTDCDSDGWQYAGMRWDNGFISWAGTYNKLLHYTRRRRLIRKSESVQATKSEPQKAVQK